MLNSDADVKSLVVQSLAVKRRKENLAWARVLCLYSSDTDVSAPFVLVVDERQEAAAVIG